MAYIHIKHTGRILLITVLIGFLFSCKKDKDEPVEDLGIDKTTVYLSEDQEDESELRDSVWYYYKLLSLWEGSVAPSEFKKIDEPGYLRNEYTKYFEKAENVLSYLMGRTELKQTATKNYDWYSFIDRNGVISPAGGPSAMTHFGFEPFYLQNAASGDNAFLYIQMVERGSPADKAGLRRSDRILSINSSTAIDYDTQQAQNFNYVNNAINASSIALTIQRIGESAPIAVTLNNTFYNFDPILKDSVYTKDDKRVGYLAFTSFEELETSFGSSTKLRADFDRIFARFSQANVNNLVVDLRSNGGGFVLTAEYLANMIIPKSADKKLMNTYRTNKYLAEMENMKSEFAPVYFNKTNDLNLDKVYFLVSSGTASASEFLINVLKPHMNVEIISKISIENGAEIQEKTYGKPVGFFSYELSQGIEIYVTSFQMFNANGEGNYFTGMTADRHVREFVSFYNFGETNEAMLREALSRISPSLTQQAVARSTSSHLRSNMRNIPVNKIMHNSQRPLGMFKEFKR